MRYFLKYISCFFAFTFFCSNIFAQEKLTPKKFSKKLQTTTNAILLDVRTAKEVSRSYIKNAVFMDFHDSLFERRLNSIDKKMPVFVYCAIGGRSHDAAVMLKKNGL